MPTRPRTVEPRETVADPVLIDPDRLMEECFDQSRRHRDCGRKLADAELAVNRSEARHELIEADLTVKIRLSPDRYGLPSKPSMDLVAAAVKCQNKYQDALDETYVLMHERDFIKAELFALVGRKGMLEKACEMQMREMGSEPRIRDVRRGIDR